MNSISHKKWLKQLTLLVVALFVTQLSRGLARAVTNEGGRVASLQAIAKSNLQFISASQVKSGDGVYVPGEWRAQVYSSPFTVLLGVGNIVGGEEEPSAFTTSSIINQLAMIYRDHPQLAQIPPMIAKAVPTLDRYREGDLYNFYPPKNLHGVRVHQAATMSLSPLWKGFTNIPQDADTTSVTYTARVFDDAINGTRAGKNFEVPETVPASFARFRDLNRAPHSYDNDQRMVNTGAFLTWQYDESDPRMPTNYFAEPEAGQRIPFNVNDVDCIVNLNVLRMLALSKKSDLAGRDQSCGLLAYVILNEGYARCGIYYPNTYNFHYSASLVDAAGETCLRPYGDKMVDFILRNQAADGGWYNQDNAHVEDRVHATAFALHGLAQFGRPGDARVRAALAKGSRFLLGRVQRSQDGNLYWQGEVFFTATAIARSLVDWKSDTFTTLVSLSALLKADQALAKPKAP